MALPPVLKLQLSLEEINQIVGRIAKFPYEEVGQLIPKIQQQVQAQAFPVVQALAPSVKAGEAVNG
jgi:hypothetical protein